MVIKIVQDKLTSLLGGDNKDDEIKIIITSRIFYNASKGLQGSGKTTSAAKMGVMLKKAKKKSLLASLDVQRPAAMEQLQILGESK